MRKFVTDMDIKAIVNTDSGTVLNAEQKTIFETLLGSTSHGTSIETLYEQNFEISGSKHVHL